MKEFAFVFPGQGSQAVGMLDAWGDHPAVAAVLQESSAALGEDIAKLIKEGPKEALALTTNTQPVMLVAGVVQKEGEVVHLIARRLFDQSRLLGRLSTRSRDFH